MKEAAPSKRYEHFFWLDILRGAAALSVVLWHWQHFFFDGSWLQQPHTIDRTGYPLYTFLRPFYGQGWRAVELFFTLSGFIFFWLYSERIVQRSITFREYLLFRISRLYPLHLVTLAVVIVGQFLFFRSNKTFFIYDDYSPISFITNLTLTSSWFSTSSSFNGPTWSVSVEMGLYVIFFLMIWLGLSRWWHAVIMVIAGWLLRGSNLDSMGIGIMSFFFGGITYYAFSQLEKNTSNATKIATASAPLIICLFILTISRLNRDFSLPFYFFELGLFPAIILALAVGERLFGPGIGRQLHLLGDISYSSYLWHFPLQLAFVLVIEYLQWNRTVFYSPITLILFYILLLAISFLSFRHFELPAQKYLRRRFQGPQKTSSNQSV